MAFRDRDRDPDAFPRHRPNGSQAVRLAPGAAPSLLVLDPQDLDGAAPKGEARPHHDLAAGVPGDLEGLGGAALAKDHPDPGDSREIEPEGMDPAAARVASHPLDRAGGPSSLGIPIGGTGPQDPMAQDLPARGTENLHVRERAAPQSR